MNRTHVTDVRPFRFAPTWRRSVALSACVLVVVAVGCGDADRPTGGPSADETAGEPPKHVFVAGSGIEMLPVPGGTFRMGSGEGNEGPRREVTVSTFLMDRYEVRQREFASLQLPDASHFKGDDQPVEMVRWSEAALACNQRSLAEGLTPCYDEATFACDFTADGYRLPTEAEWEYAARAGDDAPHPPGNPPRELTRIACFADNSGDRARPVGLGRPNAWGFHDLLGNVAEWCHDFYADDAYTLSEKIDPTGPQTGELKVLRGGSWRSTADECRVTARFRDEPGIDDACFAQDAYGFRMVRRPNAREAALLTLSIREP